MNAMRSRDTPFLNLIKISREANRRTGDFTEGSEMSTSCAATELDSQVVNKHMKIVTRWFIHLDRVYK